MAEFVLLWLLMHSSVHLRFLPKEISMMNAGLLTNHSIFVWPFMCTLIVMLVFICVIMMFYFCANFICVSVEIQNIDFDVICKKVLD